MNSTPPKVLLLGWDAADWKMIDPLMDQGQMPHLKRLIDRGVMGNIASLSPMLSPILWTSIATGKHADKHGILGFAEPDSDAGNIRPVTSTSRRCKAVWNILSDRGKRAGVINWFASHPAEPISGFVVSDRFPHAVGPPDKPWPVVAGSVHPAGMLETLGDLRVHPAATTPQQVLPFVPGLAHSNLPNDGKIGELRVLLAQCATVQAAATYMMQEMSWDFLGVYFDAIDRFAHAFMEFHPPKMEHVSDRDFELYQHVMTGVYRFHDMMLGRMIELAGEDTVVIILSDHGFHCDQLRPKGSAKIKDGSPVAWHRLHGMVVISGPGIKCDERVYGASLLDIAPTILWLMGLPVADDMDGSPLIQIADRPAAEPERIATYENGSDARGTESDDVSPDDPWVAQQMVDQLVALGYVEKNASIEGVVVDRARNLGQVYAATGRLAEAIGQFEKVLAQQPNDKAARMAIASCRMELGELDECERIVRSVLGDVADSPQAQLYMGMIAFRRGDSDSALAHLKDAEKSEPRMPGLHVQIGNVYLRRKHWRDAERAFKKALSIDLNSAEAHDGLGVAYRWQKRPAESVHEHMQSVALLHHRPQTHIHLGLALAEVGHIDWAIRAFNVALQQSPRNPFPHRCLAQLYERAKKDAEKARWHAEQAEQIRTALGS